MADAWEPFRKLKIGWAIAKEPMDIPAYRRRIGHYFERRGFQWEIADPRKRYDVVFVHHSADLTTWQRYDRSKMILDYNDDYLSGVRRGIRDLGRGTAKYLVRQWAELELDYRQAYIKTMRRADAVVCCTVAQEELVGEYCSNIHIILDMQCDEGWISKQQYGAGKTYNLVWEGLPAFEGLRKFDPVLRRLRKSHEVALHIITALKHGKFLRNFLEIDTKDEIAKKVGIDRTYLYEWNSYLFSQIVAACDLAIIPIDLKIPFWFYKPANKLLFFWRVAMPVLVDETPEYARLMKECELDMVCHSDADWADKLERYLGDETARRNAGTKARDFVERHYGERQILSQWDRVLESIL